MDGILNVYKPTGPTSFSICRLIRKILQPYQLKDSPTHKQFKVGHTGTLDPLAEGVLVVCIGKATKIIPFLNQDEKEYLTRIRLGQRTETDDAEGEVISESPIPSLDAGFMKKILKDFEGEIEQIPPIYSAVWIKGQRSYTIARSRSSVIARSRATKQSLSHFPENVGQASSLVLKPKKVQIIEIELLRWEIPDLEMRVHCSSGTYIRSLARDLGERIGCGAHVSFLKRTRVGKFKIEDSLHLFEFDSPTHQLINSHIIPMNSALDHLPEIVISETYCEKILHGNSIPNSSLINPQSPFPIPNSAIRILSETGTLLAIGKQIGDEIHPLCVLV